MSAVRAIYRHFDRELSPEAEAAMAQYAARNPKDKKGAHLYSLEEFGLSLTACSYASTAFAGSPFR